MKRKLLALIAILVLIGMLPGAALASPGTIGFYDDPEFVRKNDNLPDPLTTQQLELKEKAIEAKLAGKAPGKVHQVAKGQYVELEREGEGVLWTVLGEFADTRTARRSMAR